MMFSLHTNSGCAGSGIGSGSLLLSYFFRFFSVPILFLFRFFNSISIWYGSASIRVNGISSINITSFTRQPPSNRLFIDFSRHPLSPWQHLNDSGITGNRINSINIRHRAEADVKNELKKQQIYRRKYAEENIDHKRKYKWKAHAGPDPESR